MTFSSGERLDAADLNDLDIDSLVVDTDVLVVDKTNNRVGIGTTSPTQTLDVRGIARVGDDTNRTPGASGEGHLMIDGLGYGGYVSLDGAAMWVGNTSGSRKLYLATDETARLTVEGDGRVAIGGLAISSRQFAIRGTTTSFETRNESDVGAGSVTGGIILIGASGDATNPGIDDYFLLFRRGNGTTIGSIRGTGSASVNFLTTSDATLKTDNGLVTSERVGTIIDELEVHDFDWTDGNVSNQIGLFAQQAIGVLPESIATPAGTEPATDDEPEQYIAAGLDYSKIVPILIAECQFLRQRVATLEAG